MYSIKYFLEDNIKVIASVIGVVALGICAVLMINNAVNHGGSAQIEYSGEEKRATITIGEDDTTNEDSDIRGLGEVGEEVEVDDIPTVEEVDADRPVVDTAAGEGISLLNCPEGEECGLGAYVYAPTETASAFKNYTLGKCLNTDNAYGAQCWDLADVFWQNVTNRRAQTCGTGAAKGMTYDGCWQKNAGSEFIMIWDPAQLQAGDWVIFGNGQYGHVGMALGNYNNGYITLLGQNQGGGTCAGGGSSTNIINISLKHFTGAFRYKPYEEARIKAEEAKKVAAEASKKAQNDTESANMMSDTYTVQKGDTLGDIALKMGWYKSSEGLFGDDGYTQKLAEKNGIACRTFIYPGQVIRRV